MKEAVTYLLGVILLAAVPSLYSADQEWGTISDSVWNIRPPVTSADDGAVYIFDEGLAKTEVSGLDFIRHAQVLTYSAAGLDKVKDIEIEYFEEDKLHDLRARIVRPDGSARELGDDEFLTENIGARRITRIHFGTANPGDILEFSYRIEYFAGYDISAHGEDHLFSQHEWFTEYKKRSEGAPRVIRNEEERKQVANLPSWFFDHPVYCLRSKYVAQIGGDFDYLYYTTNMRRREQEPVTEAVKLLLATAYKKHTWELTDIPAFVPDTSLVFEDEAQRVGLHFRLFSKFGRNRMVRTNYSDEHWKNVGQSMQGYEDDYRDRSKDMMKEARRLIKNLDTDLEKVDALYSFVAEEFTADSTGYLLRPIHASLKQLYRERTGMPFELNLMLVEMLRMAGFEAWPILISTRDKVSFKKSGMFNHMLAMVNVESGSVMMDAASGGCPLGTLPPLTAVDEGVLIDFNNSQVVAFTVKQCR